MVPHAVPVAADDRGLHALLPQGYSLEEFDRAAEGELSALNRLVAERTEGQMYDRFRSDLLYNLGAVSGGTEEAWKCC